MGWVFAGIVLCLAVFVPGFRKVLLIGAGVIAGIAALIAITSSIQDENRKAARREAARAEVQTPATPPTAPKQIPATSAAAGEIRSDFQPGFTSVTHMTARIFNNSNTDTLASTQQMFLRLFGRTIGQCVPIRKSAFPLPKSVSTWRRSI
jgi:hypothetical protein